MLGETEAVALYGSDFGGLLEGLLEGARRRNLSGNSLAAYERTRRAFLAWAAAAPIQKEPQIRYLLLADIRRLLRLPQRPPAGLRRRLRRIAVCVRGVFGGAIFQPRVQPPAARRVQSARGGGRSPPTGCGIRPLRSCLTTWGRICGRSKNSSDTRISVPL